MKKGTSFHLSYSPVSWLLTEAYWANALGESSKAEKILTHIASRVIKQAEPKEKPGGE